MQKLMLGLGIIVIYLQLSLGINTLFQAIGVSSSQSTNTQNSKRIRPFNIVLPQNSSKIQDCKFRLSKMHLHREASNLFNNSKYYLIIAEKPYYHEETLRELAFELRLEVEELQAFSVTALDCERDSTELKDLTQCYEDLIQSSRTYLPALIKLRNKLNSVKYLYRDSLIIRSISKRPRPLRGMETEVNSRRRYKALNKNILKRCT